MTATHPHWFLVGAGNMGTLAAWYLTRAGHQVTVVRTADNGPLTQHLSVDGQRHSLTLPVVTPARLEQPLGHLLVACKTPYTANALRPLRPRLNADTRMLRFQNGLGALDGLLPDGIQCWEAVTTSAVKGHAGHHEVVAQNRTWMGGNPEPPAWFPPLRAHWPGLEWQADLRPRQWQKLVVNAVINPLTAIHDVPNGALADQPALTEQAATLCREADAVLSRLDPTWPGDSFANVLAVAKATAGNTSSMRADRHRGNTTEIDAINGWLLRQAHRLGQALPAHEAVTRAVKGLTPDA